MIYHAPRTGSTLLTAMLNANPNCIISNQKFILNNLNKSKEELFNIIKEGSTAGNFKPTTQILHVPKREIKVIGDKTGHRHLELLEKNPIALGQLKQKVEVPVKSILLVRNPYDTLSTWGKLNYENKVKNNKKTTLQKELNAVIEKYRLLNETIVKLKRSEDMLIVNHEFLITRMHNTLEEICNFLEISFDPQWRDNVRSNTWSKPRITRKQVNWTKNKMDKVNSIIKTYPWLKGYVYGGCSNC